MLEASGWLVLVLLLAFVAVTGNALLRRRAKVSQQLERRVAELEKLARAGRALVEAQLDLDALYELIYEQASRIIDTTTFQLGIFEPNRYHIVVWVLDGERQQPAVFDIGQGEGLVGWVRQHKVPLLIRDFESEWPNLPAHPQYLNDRPTRAAVFIPLITRDECIGVLAAQSFEPDVFTEDDVRRLSIVANQAGSAIANARYYRQVRTRAAQLELVSQVSRQVRALTPLPDLFQQTVTLIQETFGYYCVNLFHFDSENGQLNLRASTVEKMRQSFLQNPVCEGLIQWAAIHKETAVVNDVSTDTRYRSLSVLPDTRSEIVVPLIVEAQVLGVLDVQSDQLDAFGAADRMALQTLADQVALAIQESRLYNAERQQRSIAETLREVAQTLTSSLELETVLNAILTDMRRVLVYDAAAILLLEPDDVVVVRAAQGLPSVAGTQGQRFNLSESPRLERLATSEQPIIFQCDDSSGCYHVLLDLPPEHACMGAPLIAREELIGFLTVDGLPPQTYRPEDAAIIAAIAGQAAVAIDNARLFSSQRESAWVSSALLQVAEATGQSTQLDQVISAIVRMTLTLVGVDQCGILLADQERRAFHGTLLGGGGADLSEEFARLCLPFDAWLPLQTLTERPRPIVLGGGEALSALPDELFDFFGLATWLLLLPLMGKGGLIGVMLVSGEVAEVDFSRRRVQLIGGIANQAAMAIENAQLYSAQQEEAYVTVALLQVAEVVNSLTDLTDILQTIVRLAPMLTGVERCCILYWHQDQEAGWFELGPSYGVNADGADRLAETLADPIVRELLADLRATKELLSAGGAHPFPLPPVWQSLFPECMLTVFPLVTRRELVGAMLVTLPGDGPTLGLRQQNILTGITHQASIAIESDQLYAEVVERERIERELEVAREIQASFLPESHPEAPGWSLGTYWEAARQVGGDFYDFFRLLDPAVESRWGIVVADVADKGVPAALYMALSRTLIRTVAMNRTDPASSLERVNELLLKDTRSDLFVTVIYGIWDPDENTFTYANAGHNPPLRVRVDGTVEVLRQNSIVLGVLPGALMESMCLTLAPGDVLVLYTDGITDAINEHEQEFGLDRLSKVVYRYRHLPAPAITQAIQDAVADFVGPVAQFDDLTLLIIKRDP